MRFAVAVAAAARSTGELGRGGRVGVGEWLSRDVFLHNIQ